jgi:tRNA(Arg) A34 adenosine deaminase TadA
MPTDQEFMHEAISLATTKMHEGHGGPFGAVIVREGVVIARGFNRVTSTLDPTAHAEIDAIRKACQLLGTYILAGCEIFINCEPCPMCLAALYWAGIAKITYAATRRDAAAIGFADDLIYDEISLPPSARSLPMVQLMRQEALPGLAAWQEFDKKIPY